MYNLGGFSSGLASMPRLVTTRPFCTRLTRPDPTSPALVSKPWLVSPSLVFAVSSACACSGKLPYHGHLIRLGEEEWKGDCSAWDQALECKVPGLRASDPDRVARAAPKKHRSKSRSTQNAELSGEEAKAVRTVL